MIFEQKPYKAINCTYHDYIEHFTTLRKPVEIQFSDESGATLILENTVITDISGGRNGEYIHVNINGMETLIRMDNLIAVDGIKADKFNAATCAKN